MSEAMIAGERAIDTANGMRLPLTRREREVFALLAYRLTDDEIAARLFISRRTASQHVSSILGKLGARNRREAGAVAQRRGFSGSVHSAP